MIQIDMPMPKNCAECPCYGLIVFENGCNITGHEFTHNMFDGRAEDCPLKEQKAVEGHWSVLEDCAKDTKDVVDEVIENLCHFSDDEQGVCCCAIKCQEHTKKTINPTQTNAKNNALDVR